MRILKEVSLKDYNSPITNSSYYVEWQLEYNPKLKGVACEPFYAQCVASKGWCCGVKFSETNKVQLLNPMGSLSRVETAKFV